MTPFTWGLLFGFEEAFKVGNFSKIYTQTDRLLKMSIGTYTQTDRLLDFVIYNTRKYPLRGYILGVLTHTTAWDPL